MDIINLQDVSYYYKAYDDNGAVGQVVGVEGVSL